MPLRLLQMLQNGGQRVGADLSERFDNEGPDPMLGVRRFLTLLFADLCESSQLATLIDAEQFADVLRQLRAAAREVIARHGGMIARIQGDGVVAVFGYPEASEDDARRAVDSALELRDAINALELGGMRGTASRIGLHSGIHAGLVFVEEGDIERGRLDLVGHTVNTAARLCSLARDGEVCVSESALGAYRDFFEATEVRELPVKGQAEPVPVRTIVRRERAVERRFEAGARQGLSGFVGRDAAWTQLIQCWHGVNAGRTVAMLITGQPGLGKTRLIEEFARSDATRGAQVLRGYCESYIVAEALQPFLQILRAAASDGVEREPAAIARWVAERAAAQPTLLVLDDWQWADDASRQTLDRVLQADVPLLVLVASRHAAAAALQGRNLQSIDLEPLDAAGTGRVVAQRLPSRDPFLAEEIHAYAGGIPLFIEELCHAHAAGASIRADVPQSGTAWLSTLVASRLTRLGDGLAALVQLASVIGRAFPQSLLLAAADAPFGEAQLAALAFEDFLFPAEQPGFLRFKHGITRDAVYATVALAERQRLHARVAGVLQRGEGDAAQPPAEALAYHLSAAGDLARAALHAEQAGDRAMKANSLDRARDQYAAALRDLDRGGALDQDGLQQWCRVAQKLGMACVFDPISIPDREALLERAVALAGQLGDANTHARAHYWLGYARYAVGRAKRGLANCEQALALASQSGDTRLAAQVRATLGQALTAVCRYERALPLLEDAIGAKRRGASPGGSVAIGSAYALACKGLLLADQGSFGASREAFAQARALLASSAHPVAASVCGLMGISLLWQGAWDEARQVALEGAAVADASRSRQLLAMGHAIGGFARWKAEGDAAGIDAVREAVQWIEARGGLFMVSLLYGWLLDAAALRADVGGARRDAARLLLRARDGDRIGEAMGCRAMAALALGQGRGARAARWLERARQSARVRGSAHEAVHNDLAQAAWLAAAGDFARAEQMRQEAAERFAALGMSWHADAARAGQAFRAWS